MDEDYCLTSIETKEIKGSKRCDKKERKRMSVKKI